MKIRKASDMGFCFGVRRAVEMMERAAQQQGAIESLGGIVHNKEVVARLAELGVREARNLEAIQGPTVAISAHGLGLEAMEQIADKGLEIIDTTCPIVTIAQKAAKGLADNGFAVVIFGDPNHREVRGVLGWAGDRAFATTDWQEALERIRNKRRIGILSQTTETTHRFSEFANHLIAATLEDAREIRVVNSLCHTTTKQQAAALHLAAEVDLMIVVGGYHSANTRHLAEICAETGVESHHIEMAAEIDPRWLVGKSSIGVSAGASTPDYDIDEVVRRLEELSRDMEAPTLAKAES